uniref:Transposase putative helix-turn-helix domain-containing protein n=1 Tax=Globisporangium ultimum (strain ATCC 200006 / CBS 805.95 / DAOM BR144) TaxID=431595 RepID=K3W9P8_GLOUD
MFESVFVTVFYFSDQDLVNGLNALAERLIDLPNFRSWFSVRKREAQVKIERSLSDLRVFLHVQKWSVDQQVHNAKRDAFSRKRARALEMSAVRTRLSKLASERRKKTWKANEERAFDQTIQVIKKENAQLLAGEKLMLRRTRKSRLFPTKAQKKSLKQFMGTCRWTYNQAVAHFRKTKEFNAFSLRDLYVTKTSKKTRVHLDGMGRRRNIRVKMDSHVTIWSEIDILNANGFWYVAIPEYVQLLPFDNRDKCIALDPGVKAFVTGVDFESNVLKFGHDTKTHLNKLRDRRNDAQSVMSKFKNLPNKSTRW